MKRTLAGLLMLGVVGVAQAGESTVNPEVLAREIILPDDLRFFLNEARQAVRASAEGLSYQPSPETIERVRLIAKRIHEKGFGLMEELLDQFEQVLRNAFPEKSEAVTPSISKPAERTPT